MGSSPLQSEGLDQVDCDSLRSRALTSFQTFVVHPRGFLVVLFVLEAQGKVTLVTCLYLQSMICFWLKPSNLETNLG